MITAAITIAGGAIFLWFLVSMGAEAPPAYDDASPFDRPIKPSPPLTREERGECERRLVSAFPPIFRTECEGDYKRPSHNPALSLAEPQQYLVDTVGRVIDGDTLDGADTGQRYRLALVDTPERGERGYEPAKSFVERHCPVGSPMVADLDDEQPSDRYARTVVVVWCGERAAAEVVLAGGDPFDDPLNALLLAEGHACLDTRFVGASEFGSDEWTRYGEVCGGER